jgi:hypothetical protein
MSGSRLASAFEVVLERGVAPFVREPLLWPVLVVLVLHAGAGLALSLLSALRHGGRAAQALLALLLLATLAAVALELRLRRRPGALAAILAAAWLLAAAGAALAHRLALL